MLILPKIFIFVEKMINAVILVPVNCVSTTAIGTVDLLSKANLLSGKNLIKYQFVGINKGEKVATDNGIPIVIQEALGTLKKVDWLFIPAMGGDIENNIRLNKSLIPWIQKFNKDGATIISMCTGAFLLAETGLLDGKNAVTHWHYESELKHRYPKIDLIKDKIIIDYNNILMAGGAGLYTNMVLYLIEKFLGNELCVAISKFSLYDLDRISSHFAIFEGQRKHGDQNILKIQYFLEKNYNQRITLNQLVDEFNLSKRTLGRKFKEKTGNTIVEYLQRIRIEKAKKLLEATSDRVFEIAMDCGYEDITFFSLIFKKYVGITPNIYRKKFNPDYLSNISV